MIIVPTSVRCHRRDKKGLMGSDATAARNYKFPWPAGATDTQVKAHCQAQQIRRILRMDTGSDMH